MPKRNKIEMQGLVERICKMYFNDKMSHKQITEVLKEEGFDISKSGVGRTLVSQAAQMKAYKDSAKKAVAIVAELDKTPGLNISEASVQLVQAKLLEELNKFENFATISPEELLKAIARNTDAQVKIARVKLEYERGSLMEDLHARTLERIFIEERIYKKIEQMTTAEDVDKAVKKGFVPFKDELIRDVNDEDVERLLKIPIRRISLFDINKNRDQVTAINARLKEIAKRLKNLKACAIEYLNGMVEQLEKFSQLDEKNDTRYIDPKLLTRQTEVTAFSAVDIKTVVKRDIPLRYDDKGYLGTKVAGGREIIKVTPYDRIFIVRKTGIWGVQDVAEKTFVDQGMFYCNYAEKEIINKVLFTVIYRDPKTMQCYIKRCRVAGS